MGFFSRLAKHEALFDGMAQRLGIDFNAWVAHDTVHAGDYRTAVLSCTACKADGPCQAWQANTTTASEAPDFCRNKRMLETLKRT